LLIDAWIGVDHQNVNDRRLTNMVPAMAVRYVERALGERGIAELTMLTGPDLLRRIMEPGGWCELEDALAVASAAAEVCGDREIGRRAGEECLRDNIASGVAELVRAAGSPQAAIRDAAEFAHKMTQAAHHVLIEEDGRCVLEIRCHETVPGDVFLCGFAAAYLGAIPTLFGAVGTVVHEPCGAGGLGVCRFDIRWSPTGDEHVAGTKASRPRSVTALAAFEDLQAMAAELALAPDAAAVIEHVVRRVGLAANAGKALVQVRLPAEREPHYRSVGIAPNDAATVEAWAAGNFVGPRPLTDEVVVVRLEGRHGCYGHLAVFFPEGSVVGPVDRSLLEAYAGHAAAALDAVMLVDEVRRGRESAEALFRLTRRLSDLAPGVDLAREVLAAGVTLTRAHRATVVDGRRRTHFGGGTGAVRTTHLGDPVLVQTDQATGALHCSVLLDPAGPLTFTCITDGVLDLDDVRAALTALCDVASLAAANRKLVARVTHDAHHDRLTGLANRAQFEE
jgi:GAF domain-containing protein